MTRRPLVNFDLVSRIRGNGDENEEEDDDGGSAVMQRRFSIIQAHRSLESDAAAHGKPAEDHLARIFRVSAAMSPRSRFKGAVGLVKAANSFRVAGSARADQREARQRESSYEGAPKTRVPFRKSPEALPALVDPTSYREHLRDGLGAIAIGADP